MLPGLKSSPAFNAGAGSVTSMTFVTFATSTTNTITIPASANLGDYAILFDAANGYGASVAAVTPSGWTAIVGTGSDSFIAGSPNSLRQMASHRVLPAGAGGTIVTGITSVAEAKVMLIFRPSSGITSLTPSTWNREATSGNPSAQTVTASGVATPLIVFAVGGRTGTTPTAFTTETPSMTNITVGATGRSMRIGYTVYNTSPADQSIDVGDPSGDNVFQSGYVRFN